MLGAFISVVFGIWLITIVIKKVIKNSFKIATVWEQSKTKYKKNK